MKHVNMIDEDLGISEDGTHQKALTDIEACCVDILKQQAQGRENALSAMDMGDFVFPMEDKEQGKRDLRELVNHLICTHRIPICSMPGQGGGYWLPENKAEVEAVYQARRKRAFTGLIKMSRGKKSAYVDILQQITLGFDEPAGNIAIERFKFAPDKDAGPTWLKLVTRFLSMMDKDPQKYAAEISALQNSFRDIFVPRGMVIQLRRKTEELQELLKKIA